MKNFLKIFIAIVLFTGVSCKHHLDIEKEKAAIMAVIEEETAAYFEADFERWANTYVHDSTLMFLASGKYAYRLDSGWEKFQTNVKSGFPTEKRENNQVKTPLMIKVYDKSAWVVFDNKLSNPEFFGICFLEKVEDEWKMVYRNKFDYSTYFQPDYFLFYSIHYAKSMGQSVEEFAALTGDQFKTEWNNNRGIIGFVNGVRNYWRSFVLPENIIVLEQDDNHAILQLENFLVNLKDNDLFANVSYDDYLTFLEGIFLKIADYVGYNYTQETIPDGVKITITKK